MQNARGKSVVAPYSVRPRAGATVSAPVEWSEIEDKKIKIEDFTIKSIPKRVAEIGDIFKSVLRKKQKLDGAIGEVKKLIDDK
ncbi:MAG: hypothetical protein H0W76_20620 [Pyrinomonadaceae bacterium]|nr:hypothetical protein [Pyrinomonadaceae bacterium]